MYHSTVGVAEKVWCACACVRARVCVRVYSLEPGPGLRAAHEREEAQHGRGAAAARHAVVRPPRVLAVPHAPRLVRLQHTTHVASLTTHIWIPHAHFILKSN